MCGTLELLAGKMSRNDVDMDMAWRMEIFEQPLWSREEEKGPVVVREGRRSLRRWRGGGW